MDTTNPKFSKDFQLFNFVEALLIPKRYKCFIIKLYNHVLKCQCKRFDLEKLVDNPDIFEDGTFESIVPNSLKNHLDDMRLAAKVSHYLSLW